MKSINLDVPRNHDEKEKRKRILVFRFKTLPHFTLTSSVSSLCPREHTRAYKLQYIQIPQNKNLGFYPQISVAIIYT